MSPLPIICVIGPTASGKTARAIELAHERGGEIISVDSRMVYRSLDIGTEKPSLTERGGIPHHLIDIREPEDSYSAGDFVKDCAGHLFDGTMLKGPPGLITDILSRGKVPILAGGSHFYFDALIKGLPDVPVDENFRSQAEAWSLEVLVGELERIAPARAQTIDRNNRRRLVRAIEVAHHQRSEHSRVSANRYDIEWVILDLPKEELIPRIETRLIGAFERGLVAEIERTLARVGPRRLIELGLEYRLVGEFLQGQRPETTLLSALTAKLWQYARGQKRWIRKLTGR